MAKPPPPPPPPPKEPCKKLPRSRTTVVMLQDMLVSKTWATSRMIALKAAISESAAREEYLEHGENPAVPSI